MAKLKKIVEAKATITDFGSTQLSALCPFETTYRSFTLSNGEEYTWYGEKADMLPQRNKECLLLAWGTDYKTLRRVFVSWKDHKGMMQTAGMVRADKSLVRELFK